MGLSCVCCGYVLLLLVNKEAALAHDRSEYVWAGKLN